MNEPPGARVRVGLSGLTVAEYFRDDEGQDVLLFIDNIFRFTQAGSEVSALLGRMPSAVGYQPTLATEMGALQERITSTSEGFDHLGAGDLRARRRPDRPGAGHHLRPLGRDDGAVALRSPSWASIRPWTRWTRPSRILDPRIVGEEHYQVARQVQCDPADATRRCRTSSRSWAWTSFPKRTSCIVARARKIQRFLSQPFHVAEVFTGTPGVLVDVKDTVKGFKGIVQRRITITCPSRPSTWSAPSKRLSRRRKNSPRRLKLPQTGPGAVLASTYRN